MSMEKNGAITSKTPGCGNRCGCGKQASDEQEKSAEDADKSDACLAKRAVAEVVKASERSR